jgi:hypothetical protein
MYLVFIFIVNKMLLFYINVKLFLIDMTSRLGVRDPLPPIKKRCLLLCACLARERSKRSGQLRSATVRQLTLHGTVNVSKHIKTNNPDWPKTRYILINNDNNNNNNNDTIYHSNYKHVLVVDIFSDRIAYTTRRGMSV